MDNQERYDNSIRHALDARLSGIVEKPDSQQRVLRQVRGEIVVKKKISVGLILVIVLVLAAMTALAAMTLNVYYEKTIEKEGESGRIRDWSAADKVTLVDWMVDAGIELDSDKVAKLHSESLPETEKDALAMEIVEGYYPARDGILTTVDIIAKEKGPIGTWSLEDKAWYSQMQIQYENGVTNTKNILPAENELQENDAVKIAYDYYQKEYGLTDEQIASLRAENYYQECVVDEKGTIGKRWRLNFYLPDSEWPLSIELTPDGTVVWANGPYERTWRDDWYDTMMEEDFWTIKGLHEFKQKWGPKAKELMAKGELEDTGTGLLYLLSKPFELPKADDMTRDEAIKKANAAILAQPDMTQEKLDYFTTREAYRTDIPERPVYWFAYVFSYDRDIRLAAEKRHSVVGDIPYMILLKIDAKTGETVDLEMKWNSVGLSMDERTGM